MSTSDYTTESNYQKINRFFVEQIPCLDSPIIDTRPNCVTVGPYRVVTNGNIYEVWQGQTRIRNFSRRSWGVGYALCLYRGERRTATQLTEFDRQYVKLDEERHVYTHHIANSQRRGEATRADVLKCRLSRVESEILGLESRAKTILKNIHIG